MNHNINDATQIFLIHVSATANVSYECLYTVGYACNLIVRSGCTKTVEYLLTVVKPSIAR